MAILGRFYIKEKETGCIKEITYYDSKYLNIEEMTLGEMIRKSFRCLWIFVFKRQVLARKDIYNVIEVQAEDIYKTHNKWLKENDLPLVNVDEVLSRPEKEKEVPIYIN